MDKEIESMRSRLAELDGEYDKGMRAAANLELEALGGKKKMQNLMAAMRK